MRKRKWRKTRTSVASASDLSGPFVVLGIYRHFLDYLFGLVVALHAADPLRDSCCSRRLTLLFVFS